MVSLPQTAFPTSLLRCPASLTSIPTGTITFLFSDVVGSTRLWATNPEAMSASLRIHDEIFNDTMARYEGHVFFTAGDSFAAALARASAAVECAEAIQESLAGVDWGMWSPLSVRIGLHMGEAEEREDGSHGPTVNQAARVMAAAHGGQCVLHGRRAETRPGSGSPISARTFSVTSRPRST